VQQLKVQLVRLDLRRFVNDEAELAEYARDLPLGLHQWMERTPRKWPAGERDIAALARQPHLESDVIQPRCARGDGALELIADRIRERAHFGAVLCGELADAGKKLAQLTLATEEGRFDLL